MADYRPSNPVADGFDWLFGLGPHKREAEKREEERRAKLTKWQRRREDAATVSMGLGFIGAVLAVVFGPWLVGAWVILRSIFGERT